MANIITRHIPNSITCCNLICGCMATGAAFHGQYHWAVLMIVLGAVFDFFDGMSARALGVSSPIGKELDSLADVVTFGVALVFCLSLVRIRKEKLGKWEIFFGLLNIFQYLSL